MWQPSLVQFTICSVPVLFCHLFTVWAFLLQAENLLLDASGNIKIAGTYMAMLNMVVLVMMDLYVLCAPAF